MILYEVAEGIVTAGVLKLAKGAKIGAKLGKLKKTLKAMNLPGLDANKLSKLANKISQRFDDLAKRLSRGAIKRTMHSTFQRMQQRLSTNHVSQRALRY